MAKVSPSRSTLAPINSIISIRLSTSLIAGTPSKITTSSASIIAGIKATTLFFAPETATSPFKGWPPLITIFFIHLNTFSKVQPVNSTIKKGFFQYSPTEKASEKPDQSSAIKEITKYH